jgi:hypothetical protein
LIKDNTGCPPIKISLCKYAKSISTIAPTTLYPASVSKCSVALKVPPVANTSSMITTSPVPAFTSNTSVPYSLVESMYSVGGGSLPS